MTNNIKPFIWPATGHAISLNEDNIILGKPMRSDKKVLFCGIKFIKDFDNIKK